MKQLGGQANGHFQGVGAVVVVAEGEVLSWFQRSRVPGESAFSRMRRLDRYGPRRRMRTSLFTRLSNSHGRTPSTP